VAQIDGVCRGADLELAGNTGHQVANLVSLIGTSQNPEKWDLPTFSSIVWYRNKVEPGGWVGDKWQESKIHYGGHDKDIIEFFSALKSRRMHTMRKTGYESARVTLPPLPVEPTQSDPVQTDTAPSEPVQSASTSSAPNQELFPALFPQSSVDQPDAKTMSERWKIAMDADSQITTSNKEESSNSDSQGAA